MPPERAERIAEIVEQVLEAAVEQRATLIIDLCGNDPELLGEVASLLTFQEKARDFIEAPAVEKVAEILEADSAGLKPDEIVGDYKIELLIGEGGMGEVYLAEDIALGRKVALKFIKRGFGTSDLLRHFRQEERILAGLNHPNVARLYGASVTQTGIPYFVMEYVDGARLDDYCREKGLSIMERLALFRKVCSAIAYAHQNLVIHRDIKPANIRVTPEGEPKLLDFGIAKLLDPEASEIVEQTMTLVGIMTPEYASPEQVRGENITTASDVYSLGVVLFELLTGQKPYKIENRTPSNVARAITEQEPTRPSIAIAKGAGDPKSQSALGGPNPKLLKGDLDNIVLMAMRKEPARRYASVAQLSDDIRRHLEGRPVIARKDTLGYRASKFVARNKVAVAAAALILVAIVGGSIASLWEAKIARRQRDVAEREKIKAEQINDFLQSILSAASPEEKGKDATVMEVLSSATQRVETEFANRPELKAQALLTIGRTYSALGNIVETEKTLREALKLNLKLYGEENEATAASMIYLGETLLNKGDAAEAEKMLKRGVEIERKLNLASKKDLSYAIFGLGELYVRRGDYSRANPLLQEALALSEKIRGEMNEDSAYILISIGRAKHFSGDLVGAEAAYRKSIDIFHHLPQRYEIRKAMALVNLGGLLTEKGAYDEAIPLLVESDRINEKVGDSVYLLVSKEYLCAAYLDKGNYAKAIEEGKKSVSVGRKTELERFPSFTDALWCLGTSLVRVGRTAEAEPYLREALDRCRKNFPKPSARIAAAEGALGECLTAQKSYANAEPLLIDGYDMMKSKFGDQDRRVVEARQRLAKLYQAWGKSDQAVRYR